MKYIHNTCSLERTIQSYIKISNDNETRKYKVDKQENNGEKWCDQGEKWCD